MKALRWASVVCAMLLLADAVRADTLELLNGIRLNGKVLAKTDTSVTISVTLAGRDFTRKYPVAQIHAVTIGSRREVLNEKGKGGSASKPPPQSGPKKPAGNPSGEANTPTRPGATLRPRTEVEKLIRESGNAKPAWYDATQINYPQTLDLAWPMPAPKGWNNQKNVGNYLWDIVNPNPGRWREGVKLLHHLLQVNRDDRDTQLRVMNSLGQKYHNLLEDYARAAFWFRQAGVDKSGTKFPQSAVRLAECYWHLGNKQMAVELLNRTPTYFASIKLWSDMGETAKALQIAEVGARNNDPRAKVTSYLLAGDACRTAGRFPQALQYYQQALNVQASGKVQNRVQRDQQRAQASMDAIKLFELSNVSRVADGTYEGNSLGYEGQVYVEVVVRDRRIEAVRVSRHKEKQFYSALTDTPRKIIEKQGVKGVDATSSATVTSEAIINAAAKALASGAR